MKKNLQRRLKDKKIVQHDVLNCSSDSSEFKINFYNSVSLFDKTMETKTDDKKNVKS